MLDAGSIKCHAGKYVNIQFWHIRIHIQLIVVIVAVVFVFSVVAPRRYSQTTMELQSSHTHKHSHTCVHRDVPIDGFSSTTCARYRPMACSCCVCEYFRTAKSKYSDILMLVCAFQNTNTTWMPSVNCSFVNRTRCQWIDSVCVRRVAFVAKCRFRQTKVYTLAPYFIHLKGDTC